MRVSGALRSSAGSYLRRAFPSISRNKEAPFTEPGQHSKLKLDEYAPSMRVLTVPVLQDNYSYLVEDRDTGVCAAVDCAEPDRVLEAARDYGMSIRWGLHLAFSPSLFSHSLTCVCIFA